MNLASKWSRQINLWKRKRGPRSPLQKSNRTHLPFCSQVTVYPVSFIAASIRWHFTNPRNRRCPFPYLQEGYLQVRKLDYKVCWVCEGKNEILHLPWSWFCSFILSSEGNIVWSLCVCPQMPVKCLISRNRHVDEVKPMGKSLHIAVLGMFVTYNRKESFQGTQKPFSAIPIVS